MSGLRSPASAKQDSERGASAVELAILFPLLIALVLGIAEMGWMMDQRQDIRHNAQDGARLAALDFGGSANKSDDEIVAFLCDRFELYDDAEVEISLLDGNEKGDSVEVFLGQEMEQLTGMFGQFFGGAMVQSTGTSILETDANFTDLLVECGDARDAVGGP